MLRLALIVTSSLTLVAGVMISCVPLVTEPMPDIPQTVEYETVRIEYGRGDGLDEMRSEALWHQMIVGEASELALFTLQTVAGTNRMLFEHFELIEAIKAYPPSHYEEGLWRWESQDNGRYLRFQIEEEGAASHRYSLAMGLSREDYGEVFSGQFTAFERLEDRQQGFGIVRFDLDVLGAYEENSRRAGKLVIAFRSNEGVRQVRVGFDEAVFNRNDEPLDAVYDYVQFRDQRGRLIFFGRTDFDRDGEENFLAVNANWTAERAGRVAARISGESLPTPLIVEQCWDVEGIAVYARSAPTLPDYDGGTLEDCDPAMQALEVEAPIYEPSPGVEPEIPGPHREEE